MCELEKRGRGEKAEILVFGGTIEGRQVSDYLVSQRIPHTVCVATEYGEEVLTQQDYLTVHKGRMDVEEMCLFFQKENFMAVVDATHPYAVEVSKNIREACRREKMRYLRYLRAGAGNDGALGICGGDSLCESGQAGAAREKEPADTGKEQFLKNSSDRAADGGHIWVDSAREAARYLEKQAASSSSQPGARSFPYSQEKFPIKADCLPASFPPRR